VERAVGVVEVKLSGGVAGRRSLFIVVPVVSRVEVRLSRLTVAALLAVLCAAALAYYLWDFEPPRVERLELLERVGRGGVQRVLVCVREGNPTGSATLQLNGSTVEIPLTERSGGLACYASTFNVSTLFAGEGRVAGKLVVRDARGNTATVDVSFYANLEAPKIVSVELQRLDFGRYEVSARIEDENLREASILVGERSIPLAPKGGVYRAVLEVLNDTDFTLRAVDRFNLSSSYRGRIEFSRDNPNAAYALERGLNLSLVNLILPLDSDRMQDSNERAFINLIADNSRILAVPTFSNYLREKASDGVITDEELKYSSNFASLVNGIYDTIYDAKNIYEDYMYGKFKIKDPMKKIDYSSSLGLRLGFDRELAKNATAKAIAYYGIAVVDRKLPENFDEISLLTKATQIDKYGEKLVDFSPIVFHSVDGNNFVLIPDAGRETWMLAKHMKLISDSGFDVLKHPEMFEGLNGKIIANAYSIFDAEYGIRYVEERVIKPYDTDVLYLMMLQWNLYSSKAPQLGGENKLYNRDFPWYDSNKLDALYQDANTRRQALLFLFHLDNGTFDRKKKERVYGVEGARLSLAQAEKEYETISSLYPNGTLMLPVRREPADIRFWFYDWVGDRGYHGLWSTHLEFVGIDPKTATDIIASHPLDFWNYLKDYKGIDQYLTKNWKYWDLVKFIAGYERWNVVNYPPATEEVGIYYFIPQTLRAFGFPVSPINNIEPTPAGASVSEWAISLPDNIYNGLKNHSQILEGPANLFGLYYCKEGLVKDGIKEVYLMLPNGDIVIYLMKNP